VPGHPDRSTNRGMAGRDIRRLEDRSLDGVVDRCIDVGVNVGVSRAEGRLEDGCLDCVVDRCIDVVANVGVSRAERRLEDGCLDCVVDWCIDVGANGVANREGSPFEHPFHRGGGEHRGHGLW